MQEKTLQKFTFFIGSYLVELIESTKVLTISTKDIQTTSH
jgi:hypothetical protein